ncbi:hypothetical protein DFH28DRAFT_883291 [Melampsora americana]|nr:hypothetical protein DFH28DRAFT_883291 [Melampsora americana]
MAYSVYVFHILVIEFFLLRHAHVVKSFIRGPPEHTGFSSYTTSKLSSLRVLELLEPDRRISTQETHITVFRTDLAPRHFSPYKQLAQKVPRRPLSGSLKELSRAIGSIKLRDLQDMARGFRNPQQEIYIGKTIIIALEALQDNNLSIRERIWALTLLDGLRVYLPSRDMIGLRTNVAEGPVFRGALELHLAQGIDLLSIAENLWLKPSAERFTHQALAEALDRSRVLSDIKEDLQECPDYKLPPKLRRLYDILLQARFPITDKNDIDLIVACSTRKDIDWESWNPTTFTAFYNMMNHFLRYDRNIMSLISRKLLEFPLGFVTQKIFMASSVRTDLTFLLGGRHDDYLENIFEPFHGEKLVELSHFRHVVTVLKAQESALKTFKEVEYDIPFSHMQEYLMDTHSLLHVLHRCSLYHPQEVTDYLSSEVTWIGKDVFVDRSLVLIQND